MWALLNFYHIPSILLCSYLLRSQQTVCRPRKTLLGIKTISSSVMSPSTSATDWVSRSGEFERPESVFRNWIHTAPGAEFAPGRGRYHLYVAYSCPWAHRTLITIQLKGLQDVISFTAMHWLQDNHGWRFATVAEQDEKLHMTPDPHHAGVTHLRDLYLAEKPKYEGRFTTPALFDTKSNRIVSNESSDIIRMLNSSFDDVPNDRRKKVDLYPLGLRCAIDITNDWTYRDINEGVYLAGFAQSQEAYEKATRALFLALDKVEAHLSDASNPGPYYYGDCLTEVDVRLYTTIIRFDPVYLQHFKVNIRDIRHGYPAIHTWMRHLYWKVSAFHDTTKFEHIKKNYTRSHKHINPYGIVPLGPVPNVLPLDSE